MLCSSKQPRHGVRWLLCFRKASSPIYNRAVLKTKATKIAATKASNAIFFSDTVLHRNKLSWAKGTILGDKRVLLVAGSSKQPGGGLLGPATKIAALASNRKCSADQSNRNRCFWLGCCGLLLIWLLGIGGLFLTSCVHRNNFVLAIARSLNPAR